MLNDLPLAIPALKLYQSRTMLATDRGLLKKNFCKNNFLQFIVFGELNRVLIASLRTKSIK